MKKDTNIADDNLVIGVFLVVIITMTIWSALMVNDIKRDVADISVQLEFGHFRLSQHTPVTIHHKLLYRTTPHLHSPHTTTHKNHAKLPHRTAHSSTIHRSKALDKALDTWYNTGVGVKSIIVYHLHSSITNTEPHTGAQ